ncbi:MAG: cysteine--tRNA ligase [Phycisphaerae bacterium]
MTLRDHNLHVFNTLGRKRQKFEPLRPPHVGMYVCGPTVYGDAHIGHAKSYVAFDVILRYLRYLGYDVTYVQNITDVGHLTDDADEGEDKVEKAARARRVHPMQIAETYTRRYFEDMDRLNVLRPDISPRASGHIIEQIEHVKRLLETGHAYEVGGNVYFDVTSWDGYGRLSGRSVEEMQAGARVQTRGEKRHPADFALWKAAEPGHIMQWPSPWGMGYPGWHIECTVMAQKYLGPAVDIHGGGIENQFPHHENEIAQAEAAGDAPFVTYWLHNNMVTVDGRKMGKSLGNFITLRDAFERWDPMVLRLFLLQTHYRSPTDFSEEALEAAREGLERLFRPYAAVAARLSSMDPGPPSVEAREARESARSAFLAAMDDDFNTPMALAALFELTKETNKTLQDGNATQGSLILFAMTMFETASFVLGLAREKSTAETKTDTSEGKPLLSSLSSADAIEQVRATETVLRGISASFGEKETKAGLSEIVIDCLVKLRNDARAAKDFAQADTIRKRLDEIGIILEDTLDGTIWRFK